MTSLTVRGTRSFKDVSSSERVFHRQAGPRGVQPVPLWPGHDYTSLFKGYCSHVPDPAALAATRPELSLYLNTMQNAWFTIANGLDGVIFDHDGWLVGEPSCFHDSELTAPGRDLVAELGPVVELDDVFIGHDAAWGNYFHFLCYTAARCHMANKRVPSSCQLIIPDYRSRHGRSNLSYSEATYDQAFSLTGLADRVTRLPTGLYHANTLRFFWTEPHDPTQILDAPEFLLLFDDIRRSLTIDPRAPRRLLVSRDAAPDPRMGFEARDLVRRMCADRGFTIIRFEEMDLRAQAQALYNADCIVAPHGAGLINTLFGRSDLRVLELNTELDGNGSMRAWFFQLAALRDQTYMALNGSRGEIMPATLARALDICCKGH
jgi:hypothetical protein